MTLFDFAGRDGYVSEIGCGDAHRRLVDLGLLGSRVTVKARKPAGIYAEFSGGFSAVIGARAAREIFIETLSK